MTKEPTRSEKAALDPSVMAPKAVVMRPVKTVAGMGQERGSLTEEKKDEKGTALSRASAHQVRPTVRKVPMRQGARERKMMKRRPKVAPVEPVAWE
jgi:hypothetical protein